MEVLIKAWGPYACFSRPEFSTERKSYDIITPSAARNMLEAIYWHPGVTYRIKKIWVRKPIRFVNIRRNEVSEVASADKVLQAARTGKGDISLTASSCIQQRMATVLRDVEYYILADVSIDKSTANANSSMKKLCGILTERLERGACFNQPYFGTREFSAYFQPCSKSDIPPCPSSLIGERDMGVMLYDMDYSDTADIRPIFFHPIMKDGCVEVKAP